MWGEMLWGYSRSCIISFLAPLCSSLLFTANFTLASSSSPPWKWHSVHMQGFKCNHRLKKSKPKPAFQKFAFCRFQWIFKHILDIQTKIEWIFFYYWERSTAPQNALLLYTPLLRAQSFLNSLKKLKCLFANHIPPVRDQTEGKMN